MSDAATYHRIQRAAAALIQPTPSRPAGSAAWWGEVHRAEQVLLAELLPSYLGRGCPALKHVNIPAPEPTLGDLFKGWTAGQG